MACTQGLILHNVIDFLGGGTFFFIFRYFVRRIFQYLDDVVFSSIPSDGGQQHKYYVLLCIILNCMQCI